jgi:hypothetical protein
VALSAFVDEKLAAFDPLPFLAGCAIVFLFGLLRQRSQAVAGLAGAIGVVAVVAHNDPSGGVGGFGFISIIFAVI